MPTYNFQQEEKHLYLFHSVAYYIYYFLLLPFKTQDNLKIQRVIVRGSKRKGFPPIPQSLESRLPHSDFALGVQDQMISMRVGSILRQTSLTNSLVNWEFVTLRFHAISRRRRLQSDLQWVGKVRFTADSHFSK